MNDHLIKTENLCKIYQTGDLRVEVLKKNKPMLDLFKKSAGKQRAVHQLDEEDVWSLWYFFEEEAQEE